MLARLWNLGSIQAENRGFVELQGTQGCSAAGNVSPMVASSAVVRVNIHNHAHIVLKVGCMCRLDQGWCFVQFWRWPTTKIDSTGSRFLRSEMWPRSILCRPCGWACTGEG